MGKLAPVPLLDTRRVIIALGGVIAAVAGALAGMGTPRVDLPLMEDVPGGAVERPALPVVLLGKAGEDSGPSSGSSPGEAPPSGKIRRSTGEMLPGIHGWIVGPTGPLESAPVELVPFPRAGEPRRAGIKVLSGPGGKFSFENMGLAPEEWALVVHAPGFGIRALALPPRGPSWPGRVDVVYGKWLTGKAASSSGSPVGLARVWVGLPLEGDQKGRVLWRRAGRTSREGRFVARDLPPDRPSYILVDHPLFAPSRPIQVFPSSGGTPDPLALSLAEGRKIEGKVLSRDGRPRARLFIFWEKNHQGGLLLRRGASTDAEGRFLLQGLPWDPPPACLWVADSAGKPRRIDLGRAVARKNGPLSIRLPW